MDYERELLEDELNFMRERQQLRWQRERQKREQERRRRYFIKQRLYGLMLVAITVLEVIALDGDATVAFFTLPIAGYMIFSKEMLVVDNYYWETKERKYK